VVRQRHQDGSVAEFRIDPEDLCRLAGLVEDNGLSELRYEEGDLRITLRTAAYRPAPVHPVAMIAPFEEADIDNVRVHVVAPDHPDAESAVPSAELSRIEAPVMGVFYRAPKPGEPPYIEVGDIVEDGQPIGMIEAMKVFSEVLSEVSGRVREIPARSGALVHPGETLVIVEADQ